MKHTLIAIAAFASIIAAVGTPRTGHALDGDVNGDCTVNTLDLYQVGVRYGAFYGSLRYSATYDLNSDRQIDVRDLQLVAGQFGQTC